MDTFDLLKLIMQVKEGYTLQEILYYTKLPEEVVKEFLNDLIQAEIIKKEEENYRLADHNLQLGKIHLTTKKGWIVVGPEKEYLISNKDNLYKNGEYALFVVRENKKNPSANIKLSFPKENLWIGEVKRNGEKTYIVKKDETLIPLEGATHDLVDGSIVSYSKNGDSAQFLSLLCHSNDPDFMIKKVVKELNIPYEFNETVKEEIKKIPFEVTEQDILGCRDLRDEEVFTIDGTFAKDFDDAVSLKINEKGNFVLKVHIAHVSHYVKEGSAIDIEAQTRGTSVYMLNKVIPMLPGILSYEICSLKPFVDRLTRTCEMEYDKEGNMIRYEIYPSVIRSKMRMTYTQVNNIFEEKEYHSSYNPFIETLYKMRKLSNILRKKAIKNGFIDFEKNDLEFILEDDFTVSSVYQQIRGESEKMIEMFMLEANKTVAFDMYQKHQNILYRIHEFPELESVNESLITLNLEPFDKYHKINNKDIQTILESLKNNENYQILSTIILQSFKKACYSPINHGHFGISAPFYTHFTSPIRRYPDLLLHRALDNYDKNNTKEYSLKEQVYLQVLGEHLNKTEKRSDIAEKFVSEEYAASYLQPSIGESFNAHISLITSKKIHVQLSNLIEGKLKCLGKIRLVKNGEAMVELKGQQKRIRLGDSVQVYLLEANPIKREIVFSLEKPKTKIKKY